MDEFLVAGASKQSISVASPSNNQSQGIDFAAAYTVLIKAYLRTRSIQQQEPSLEMEQKDEQTTL